VDSTDCSYPMSSQLCRLEFQPLLNSPDQSKPSSSRFAEPVTEQTLVQFKEATTPSGTRTATNWAYMTMEVQGAEKKPLVLTFNLH